MLAMYEPACKHSQIARALIGEIRGGKYADAAFPSENALVRRFGVSRSTVRQALQKLRLAGYVRSSRGSGTLLTSFARTLGGAVGLLVPGFSYAEIFPPICREVSRLAQARDLEVIFGDTSQADAAERAARMRDFARRCVRECAAGAILQPLEFVPRAEETNREVVSIFDEAGIPVVLIDYDLVAPPRRSGYDLVGINNFEAGRRLGEHLKETGARNVRFLVKPDNANSVTERALGVASVFGVAPGRLCATVDAADARAVAALMRTKPDALVCRNDTCAARLLATLARLGRRVPDDVRVAGFDDVQHASLVRPALTTVRQPCADIARVAFDFLLSRIADPSLPPRECYLPAPLVVRESTAAPVRRGNKTKGKPKK